MHVWVESLEHVGDQAVGLCVQRLDDDDRERPAAAARVAQTRCHQDGSHNLRRLALLETNLVDLSFLFTLDQGEAISQHLGHEALAVFETPHHTPYAFNLHGQDVGHTLVVGATGSGKSFLLNFLITHAQKYSPQTVVLDLGHSYRKLATLLGGRYLEVGCASKASRSIPLRSIRRRSTCTLRATRT